MRQLLELGGVVFRSTALERERLLQPVGCNSHLCDDETHIGGGGEQALLVLQGGEGFVRLLDSVREDGRIVGHVSANQNAEAFDVDLTCSIAAVSPLVPAAITSS